MLKIIIRNITIFYYYHKHVLISLGTLQMWELYYALVALRTVSSVAHGSTVSEVKLSSLVLFFFHRFGSESHQ